jgi:hypothetical protein
MAAVHLTSFDKSPDHLSFHKNFIDGNIDIDVSPRKFDDLTVRFAGLVPFSHAKPGKSKGMMSRRSRLATAACFLLLFMAGGWSLAGAADAPRSAGLQRAWKAPGSVRSVFFVGNMSCRACTFLLDRKLAREEGVYWTRFNYPLRLLVIYHDPGTFPISRVEGFVSQAGELSTVLLESRPAVGYRPAAGEPPARWKGGTLTLEEALGAPKPFEATLREMMIERGTGEWDQIAYEIAGEEARNRIFLELARAAGYGSGGNPVEQPIMIAKDFYWPVELLPLTADEATVARFVRERVIKDDEQEAGRERFDSWLLGLWKELSFDFRGEYLELQD